MKLFNAQSSLRIFSDLDQIIHNRPRHFIVSTSDIITLFIEEKKYEIEKEKLSLQRERLEFEKEKFQYEIGLKHIKNKYPTLDDIA